MRFPVKLVSSREGSFLLLMLNRWKKRQKKQSLGLNMKGLSLMLLGFSSLLVISCGGRDDAKISQDPEALAKILQKNPEILTETIQAHPVKFMDAVQDALEKSKKALLKRQQKEEKQRLKHYYENPLNVSLRGDEAYKGEWGASIQVVAYSDFQCPYCRQGNETIQRLLKEYDGNIVYIFKHLPLNFHDQAMDAAKIFEAIRMISKSKAMAFHDYVFQNQENFKQGRAFFFQAAEKVGVEKTAILEKMDQEESKILERIKADKKEAQKFGIKGTPGYILNGIPIKGAYPKKKFVDVISKLQSKNKLSF